MYIARRDKARRAVPEPNDELPGVVKRLERTAQALLPCLHKDFASKPHGALKP
jgi:hypothetical protein